MDIKDELLEGHIKRVIKESLKDVIFDSSLSVKVAIRTCLKMCNLGIF